MDKKPVLGILLGDSAGVGPEIVAKLAANGFLQGHCRPVIIGDMRIFERALDVVGMQAEHYSIGKVSEADWGRGIPVLDQKNQDPAKIPFGKVDASSGKAVNDAIALASDLCKSGKIEGFVFAPFNKTSMREGGLEFESEHHLLAHIFGVSDRPFGELNVLDGLMCTRASSHIPIKEVSDFLNIDRIVRAITMSYETLKLSGLERPRIAVAALNPHAGEHGKCGREEIDMIEPAIQKARALGIEAEGPFPSDILFIKAFNGDFDGVVTMFHDQGQIALKLKGFEQGITVAGGQPYPIATPAHGTAFDIAGKGIATTTAAENAVIMAVNMALNNRK